MCRNRQRLMIIKLGKYNSADELLIGHMNARLQRWVINWNMERRVSVARAAVRMKEKENGTRDKRSGLHTSDL